MTAILAFLGPLAKLLEGVFSWLRDNQIRQQGRTEQRAEDQKETSHEVRVADEAREAVRAELAAEPERLREHDEFERPA